MISKYKQIKKYIEKWQKKLFLHGWRITFEIASKKEINILENDLGKIDSYAFSHLGYPMRKIHIRFNPKHINHDLEKTILHELLHCLNEPLRQTILSVVNEYIKNTKHWNLTVDNINCRVDELIEQLTDVLLN